MSFFDTLTQKKTSLAPFWKALPLTPKHNRRIRRSRRVAYFA